MDFQPRQMFQDTQQEVVGYAAAPHQGIELLEGLRQLGYTYCNLVQLFKKSLFLTPIVGPKKVLVKKISSKEVNQKGEDVYKFIHA